MNSDDFRRYGPDHTGHSIRLDQMTDAYYCATCNEWLDPKCGDAECMYCEGRPDRPLLAWVDAEGVAQRLPSLGSVVVSPAQDTP